MKNYNFNVEQTTEDVVAWIKNWFDKNGNGCNAVIGMSGGKDSTIAAALLVKALGQHRVIGVAMPDKGQGINDADKICEHFGIRYIVASIAPAAEAMRTQSILDNGEPVNSMWSVQSQQNIPPRLRMAMLYAISQSNNGRVVNTCNLSENWIGYSTRYGDDAGDFSPLSKLTVTEILAIGDYLGIPYKWVHKTPDDGLPHSCPDEEKLGFTYAELDKYIREGIVPVGNIPNSVEPKKFKIDRMHDINEFKTRYMDVYDVPENYIYEV